jgi:hypothetical protein
MRELEEILRLREAGPAAAFARAAFRPFGLDGHWRGLRWFGGSGSSNDLVNRLELAHGDAPWDPASQQVRVQTLVPSHIGLDGTRQTIAGERALLAQEQVRSFWHHTGQLPEEVRRAAFPLNAGVADPTEPWADRELTIDGAAVSFRVAPGRRILAGSSPTRRCHCRHRVERLAARQNRTRNRRRR